MAINARSVLSAVVISILLSGCLESKSTQSGSRSSSSSSTTKTCVVNEVTSELCLAAPGVLVSSTFGSNITDWTNLDAGTIVSATIPNASYMNRKVQFTDANLKPENIQFGKTIFGVSGSFKGTFQVNMNSTQHRTRTSNPMSLQSEATSFAGTPYPSTYTGYHAVPRIGEDDDGANNLNVVHVNRTSWGSHNCGRTQLTIAARIADCAAHPVIGAEATWSGASKGNAGHGEWKLVTRTGAASSGKGREVWRDERTGLLWSSKVATALNWCKASGNNGIVNNPFSENDLSDICDNPTHQITGTWSLGNNKAISACFEDSEDNGANDFFTTTDPDIDSAGKGDLSLSSSPAVAWRLPSLYDYQLARTNGMQYVLPDHAYVDANTKEWSSTVSALDRSFAYDLTSGLLTQSLTTRDQNNAVRCVGR